MKVSFTTTVKKEGETVGIIQSYGWR